MTATQLSRAVLLCAVLGLSAGTIALVLGDPALAGAIWIAGTIPVLAALGAEILSSLRRGEVGLDLVAALSMSAALLVGEHAAAAVVALMYAGGTALEAFAERRAAADMTALLARAPRRALRHDGDGITEIAAGEIAPGDRLLVRQGDLVPADGYAAGAAVVDLSALTGESLPERIAPGRDLPSGAVNAGAAFDMIATRRAEDSTYAGIVRMVEQARASRAPMARLADRWALAFLGVTLVLAGGAWAASGDPVRAVAVLVIATPCPLILAVPVALVAGLSRAARFGILVKGGAALETLARLRGLVLDKTGTLTEGRPRLAAIQPAPGRDGEEMLRLAAALDQVSAHPMARALVAEARARGLDLPRPRDTSETPGEGVTGMVEGRRIAVGSAAFAGMPADAAPTPGVAVVAVAIDGRPAGTLTFADPLRDGAGALLDRLRAEGIGRIVLATGDRADVAAAVARGLPLDLVAAGLTPAGKIAVVRAERGHGPVAMVGDGVNDAPALAAADLGIAMGARGAAASAEAADVVFLVDRLALLLPALRIARRSRAIALQSVVAGLGLSLAGMVAAAFGLIAPVQGALAQEAIDVVVILNALRALRVDPGTDDT